MKNIYYIILVCCCVCPSINAYDYNRIEQAPAITDSNEVSIHQYYLRSSFGYPNGGSLEFKKDYTFYYCDSLAGSWRVNRDTLFLYEKAVDKVSENVLLDMFGSTDSLYLDSIYREMPIFAPSYRQVINIDPFSDYPYAANVTAYIIHNYGDSLVSLYPYFLDKNESKPDYFVYTTEHYFYNKPKHAGGGVFYSFSSKKAAQEYSKLLSYRPWRNVEIDWQEGEFVVNDKVLQSGEVLIVELGRDSITYQVVNPKYYLKNDSAKLYEKKDEKALTEWMSDVKVGETYKFRLQRPAYPADSLAKIPRLNTGSNSLCIGETEAYGYFFARLIK